jgi:ferredoxin
MRLDPLAMLSHMLASRTLLASSGLALVTLAVTLFLGRVWCGWLCPLGTILDHSVGLTARRFQNLPGDSWRQVKYALLLTLVAAAALSNLSLMVLDPLTILFRTLSASVWPAVDQIISAAELILYQLPALRPAVSAFDGWARPKVLPPDPAFYRHAWVYASVLAGIVSLNWIAPRFWCRYLCPLGALLGLLSKVSIIRRRVDERCNACGACARVCPTGTIQADDEYESDPGECTMCLECYAICPQDAVGFQSQSSVARWNAYDPSRRQAALALGAAVAGISLFRSDLVSVRDNPHLIRPPGARENDLLSKCIRCAECSRACPTSAIQPAITEAGLEGLWTPVLVPRAGYCDYSCNACGQVCPVQAIPPLSLDQKRAQVIGKAYIDRNRCIPWADGQPCGVCEEMCPVPEKAIRLEELEMQRTDGQRWTLQRPLMLRDRCIGCGLCEYRCPLNGQAAIRVYVPTA